MEKLYVVGGADNILFVVMQKICHGFECLGGGVRPGLPTPPATACLEDKLWVVALDRHRPVGCEEVVGVHQELPRGLEASIYHPELPWNVAMFFTAVGATRVFPGLVGQGVLFDDVAIGIGFVAHRHREEELTLWIPEELLDICLQGFGFGLIGLRGCGIAVSLSCLDDGKGIGVHVGVEPGAIAIGTAEDVLGLAAIDVEFHAIIVAILPE